MGRPAAHRDQVVVAGQLLDGVLGKVQVAVHGLGQIAERRLDLPQGHVIEQHVGVANEDHGSVLGAFLEGIIRLFLRRFLLRLAGSFLLVLVLLVLILFVFGLAAREGGLEFAGQADREPVGRAGRFEFLQNVCAGEVRHETVHKLRFGRALQQHRLLQTRHRSAGKRASIRQPQVVNLAGDNIVPIDPIGCD